MAVIDTDQRLYETDLRVDVDDIVRATTGLLDALRVADGGGSRARQMAHALTRMVTRDPLTLKAVANDAGHQALMLSKGIGFRALCDVHMLPLSGVVHIGYVPDQLLLTPAEPSLVVGHFACQPQSPQRLASQTAHWLDRQLQPLGIGVVVHAHHSCISDPNSGEADVTVASILLGQFRDNSLLRAQFLSLTASR